MPTQDDLANLIWQIADLLWGPYQPPQYERVMLPMTVLLPVRGPTHFTQSSRLGKDRTECWV